MVVVVVRISSTPEKREELLRRVRGMVGPSRAEEGCLSYRFYEDIENENDFTFVEEWESREALDRHFQTPHFADFMQALPELIAGAPDLKIHEVASTEPL